MANTYDDFESYSVASGAPTGWTLRAIDGGDCAVEIIDTAGDQGLFGNSSGTAENTICSLDSIDSDADRDDFEIYGRFSDVHGFTAIGPGGRFSGSGSATGYALMTAADGSNKIILRKVVGGSQTNITSFAFSRTAGNIYRFRFRVIGTSLKGRVWADGDSEPGTWDVDTTDSDVSGAGWCGVFYNRNTGACYDIAIATNGDTATFSAGGPAEYTITGDVTVTLGVSATTAYNRHAAITGDTTITFGVVGTTAYNRNASITGDVPITLSVDGQPVYNRNAAIVGDTTVTLGVAGDTVYNRHASIAGDVTLTLTPAAVTEYSSGNAIVGDVTVTLGVAGDMAYNRHAAIIGDTTLTLAVAGAMDYTAASAIVGDVTITFDVAGAMAYNRHSSITGDVTIATTVAGAMLYTAAGATVEISSSYCLAYAITSAAPAWAITSAAPTWAITSAAPAYSLSTC